MSTELLSGKTRCISSFVFDKILSVQVSLKPFNPSLHIDSQEAKKGFYDFERAGGFSSIIFYQRQLFSADFSAVAGVQTRTRGFKTNSASEL